MTFITTGLAVAGLAAVAIPIIIHLLWRQRRKPIEWAAMRFLLEAFRKHKRRLQLEQLILLATRCLIVALLGAALARPILESAGIIKPGGARAIYLVIDDGMASGVTGDDSHNALQRHIRQAVDVVNSLGAGDAVGVITAARPAKALLIPPSTDRAAVIDVLQSLAPRESPTDLPGAFSFVRTAVDEAKATRQQSLVYLFSDFRAGSAALDSPLPSTHADSTSDVKLLASPPAGESITNVQVVAIEPVRSLVLPDAIEGSGQVTVRLRRTGGQLGADVSRVRLTVEGGAPLEPKVVQWQPGQVEANVEFMLNYGGSDRALGLTAVIDSDPLVADNQRYSIVELRTQLRVLLVDRRSFGFERALDRFTSGQWIRRALEPIEKSPIQIVEAEPAAIDLPDVRTADVVFLPRPDLLSDSGWNVLRQFLRQNGLLIITPPAEVNVHQWSEHLSKDLNLPWRLSLEVHEYKDGLPLAEEQPSGELLRLLSSELSEMGRPVLAHRVLPIDAETTTAGLFQPLLMFEGGIPMAIAGSPQSDAQSSDQREPRSPAAPAQGLVIYMSVAPDDAWTNLPYNPLMVPLFQEMVRQGLSVIRGSQRITVGEQPNLARGPAAHDLAGPQDQRIALDGNGKPQQPIEHAGVYGVLDQTDQVIGKVAVNIDPGAGNTDVQSAAAVASWLQASGPWAMFDAANLSASLSGNITGSPIAGLLLMAVLGLALAETLLARWFSHANRDSINLQLSGTGAGGSRGRELIAHSSEQASQGHS